MPARNAARKLRETVDGVAKSKSGLDSLQKHIGDIQRALDVQFNTISNIGRAIDGFTGLPTPSQLRQIEWAWEDGAKSVEELNGISEKEVPDALRDFASAPEHIAPPARRP